ncbi:MAG TPA: AAA family ATPase, partial [Polyangiales bacterium]|nr:AAA family ATPase [Polyangiales bacterium]
ARPGSAAEVIEHLTVIAGLDPDEQVEVARAYLSAPTLLGREDEVLRFRKQLLRCGRGRGSVAIVEAPPGMGRSRLLHAVELEGKLAGGVVLRAKGEPDRNHGVLQAICRELLATMPEVAVAAARPYGPVLAHALPELKERLGTIELAQPSGGEEIEDKIELAACQWLLALSKRQSVVITVDDVDRADPSSLSLLALLAQHAPEQRIALVLSSAEGATSSAPIAIATLRRKATLVALSPLSEEQTAQLACAVFGDVPNVARVSDWMHRLARGNPRTCMELAAHLVERDIARYEQGGWLLPATLPEHELPTSLENALEQRLAALGPQARELAAGLALCDIALKLEEYALLMPDAETASETMFRAIDELVAAGVLVTRNEAYAFSQGGYVEAARRELDPALMVQLRRRLAKVFARRADLARQAAHLLYAGDEIEALQAIADYHRETGGYLAPDPQGALSPSRRRTLMLGAVEDTTAAVETRKRLLAAAERHDWPQRERIMIRNGLLMLAQAYDSSLMRGQIEPHLERLRVDSGAIYWERFADVASPAERAQRCMQQAQSVYDETPADQRVLTPMEAIGAMIMTIGTAQTMCRQSFELPLLQVAEELCHFLTGMSPLLKPFHTTTMHTIELVRGRFDLAAALRAEMLAFYDELWASGRPITAVSRVGRAIISLIEGFERARLGDEAAFAHAELLETGGMFPEEDRSFIGLHIWVRRAWEIRRVYHLYCGDAANARRCQEQLDQLSTRHAYAPYGGGAAFHEAQAFALTGDLMGLKQSIEAITLIVERQYPDWTPFLQVATGDYHRLRGEHERALQAYDWALAATSAGVHPAWAPACSARVETLLALGRGDEAALDAERALSECKRAELGLVSELELERVLALCEAGKGQIAVAADRIERALARTIERGIHGVRVGVLYEARARVALAGGDADGFASFAAQAAEVYRAGRNPALVAKYERLIEAARSSEIALSTELTHAAEISAALGLSQEGNGFHTAFAECEDGDERKVRALRLLLDRTGAKSGFLYSAGEKGAVALQASEPQSEPPAELEAALRDYLRGELEDTSDVTMTCFDEGARTSSLGMATAFQPVLLWGTADGERSIVGIAALRCEQSHFTAPGWDLLAAVSKVLIERDEEVVSIVG